MARLPARIVSWLTSVVYVASCVALLVMTISVGYEVVMRYVFNRPTQWSFEISSLSLLVLALLAAGHIHRKDLHIKMDFFQEILPVKALAWRQLFLNILGACYCFFVVWKGWEFAMSGYHYHSTSAMALPLFPFFLLIPIGFFIWGLQCIIKIIESLRSLREKPNLGG